MDSFHLHIWKTSNWTLIPPTQNPKTYLKLKFCIRFAKKMKLLTVPSLSPMHRRLPKLKGMKASGIVIFPSPSKNLSGLKVSGSLQYCSPMRNQTVKLSIFKKQLFIYSSFYFCRFWYVKGGQNWKYEQNKLKKER